VRIEFQLPDNSALIHASGSVMWTQLGTNRSQFSNNSGGGARQLNAWLESILPHDADSIPSDAAAAQEPTHRGLPARTSRSIVVQTVRPHKIDETALRVALINFTAVYRLHLRLAMHHNAFTWRAQYANQRSLRPAPVTMASKNLPDLLLMLTAAMRFDMARPPARRILFHGAVGGGGSKIVIRVGAFWPDRRL